VGIVSFIGYTPDIFFAPVAGRILDAAPGAQGHQNYFLFLACCALLGGLVVAWLARLGKKPASKSVPAPDPNA
ncbi:MAG: hypothetical protein RQ826_11660, partial [Xanthomonadales bacterium]|nr:hypothetical protein [Xanthomonadales bacterium]